MFAVSLRYCSHWYLVPFLSFVFIMVPFSAGGSPIPYSPEPFNDPGTMYEEDPMAAIDATNWTAADFKDSYTNLDFSGGTDVEAEEAHMVNGEIKMVDVIYKQDLAALSNKIWDCSQAGAPQVKAIAR